MKAKKLRLAAMGAAASILSSAGLAALVMAQSGEATSDQIQACVDAAAEDLGVMEGQVMAMTSSVGEDGTVTVNLEVHGDGATCTISPSGHAEVSYG